MRIIGALCCVRQTIPVHFSNPWRILTKSSASHSRKSRSSSAHTKRVSDAPGTSGRTFLSLSLCAGFESTNFALGPWSAMGRQEGCRASARSSRARPEHGVKVRLNLEPGSVRSPSSLALAPRRRFQRSAARQTPPSPLGKGVHGAELRGNAARARGLAVSAWEPGWDQHRQAPPGELPPRRSRGEPTGAAAAMLAARSAVL